MPPDHTTLSRRAATNADGRMPWQISTGYAKRSLVETVIGRYKSINGLRQLARLFAAQQMEIAMGYSALNSMLACARPKSVRCNIPAAYQHN